MFMKNLFKISQGSIKKHRKDGFPISLTLFHVISKSMKLISFYINRKDFSMKSATHSFNEVCSYFFDDNVFLCLNDFIFHFMSIFIYSWHIGIDNLKYNLGHCLEYNNNLYQHLYTIEVSKDNKHTISQLNEIIIESFQLASLFFHHLVDIERKTANID